MFGKVLYCHLVERDKGFLVSALAAFLMGTFTTWSRTHYSVGDESIVSGEGGG